MTESVALQKYLPAVFTYDQMIWEPHPTSIVENNIHIAKYVYVGHVAPRPTYKWHFMLYKRFSTYVMY